MNKTLFVLTLSCIATFTCKAAGSEKAQARLILNSRDDFLNRTPLHVSTQHNKLKCMQRFLQEHASLDSSASEIMAQDRLGFSPLHTAAINDNLKAVQLLLKHLIRLNAKNEILYQDNMGLTALNVARIPEIKQEIIEAIKMIEENK